MRPIVAEQETLSAADHAGWAARGLKDFGDYADCVEYVNQREDYADSSAGDWYYGDDDTLVVYEGTFGNDHSPGSDHYTTANLYPDRDMYLERMAELESCPEYLDSDDS
jgi:hypothetical protein